MMLLQVSERFPKTLVGATQPKREKKGARVAQLNETFRRISAQRSKSDRERRKRRGRDGKRRRGTVKQLKVRLGARYSTLDVV